LSPILQGELTTMNTMKLAVATLFGLGVALVAMAADELKVGDKAPAFELKGSDGKTYKLEDFKGKKGVVIAWFPKAFTGGCTKECKSLKTGSDSLKKSNVAYFTASVDPVDGEKGNAAFAKSLDLDYPILSDPDKTVATAYGVLRPVGGFANRWTFYIDKEGVIREIDKKVNTKEAATDAAAKVKSLGIGG
jgi:thioredoxin-dependent peroxiredoxin